MTSLTSGNASDFMLFLSANDFHTALECRLKLTRKLFSSGFISVRPPTYFSFEENDEISWIVTKICRYLLTDFRHV